MEKTKLLKHINNLLPLLEAKKLNKLYEYILFLFTT